ncbi:MAG: hypothetical protein AAF502_15795 [Bacteroidota bacterium]
MNQYRFVLVECGNQNRIRLLELTLQSIRENSFIPIVVITDLSRNENAIEADKIYDVKCPASLNDLQARWYLVTRMHKILDSGFRYCFVQSGVIAINNGIDRIFNMLAEQVSLYAEPQNPRLIDFFVKRTGLSNLDSTQITRSGGLVDYNLWDENIRDWITELKEFLFHRGEFFKKVHRIYSRLSFNTFWITIVNNYVRAASFNRNVKINSDGSISNLFVFIKQKIAPIVEHSFSWIITRFGNIQVLEEDADYKLIEAIDLEQEMKKFGYSWNNQLKTWQNKSSKTLFQLSIPKEVNSDPKLKQLWEKRKQSLLKTLLYEELDTNQSLASYLNQIYMKDIPEQFSDFWDPGVILFNDESDTFFEKWHENLMFLYQERKLDLNGEIPLGLTIWEMELYNGFTLPKEMNFLLFKDSDFIYLGKSVFKNKHGQIFKPSFLNIQRVDELDIDDFSFLQKPIDISS